MRWSLLSQPDPDAINARKKTYPQKLVQLLRNSRRNFGSLKFKSRSGFSAHFKIFFLSSFETCRRPRSQAIIIVKLGSEHAKKKSSCDCTSWYALIDIYVPRNTQVGFTLESRVIMLIAAERPSTESSIYSFEIAFSRWILLDTFLSFYSSSSNWKLPITFHGYYQSTQPHCVNEILCLFMFALTFVTATDHN